MELSGRQPATKSSPLPIFVNNVILEKATLMHLQIVYIGFHSTTTELSCYNRDYAACKAKNIYSLALYRSLPIPAVGK